MVIKGYVAGSVNWQAVAAYSKDVSDTYGTPKIELLGKTNYDSVQVREDIDSNNPVIIGLDTKPDINHGPDHWVVAVGYTGTTIWINDPLSGEGKDSLDDPAYEGKAVAMVRYRRTSNDFSAIVVAALDPVQFVVTDPNGEQTGYDPISDTVITEIPDSFYYYDEAISPDRGDRQAPVEQNGVYWSIILTPVNGVYGLDITEMANPGYGFVVYAYDSEADLAINIFERDTNIEFPTNYSFIYDPDPTGRSITLEVSVDVKPGSQPNSINCKRFGKEVVTVAVLTAAAIEAGCGSGLSASLL